MTYHFDERNMNIRIMPLILLLATSSTYGREPPISFPPMTGNIPADTMARCETTLDQTIYPSLAFSNTPIGDALGYLAERSPDYDPKHSGLSTVYNMTRGNTLPALLPPTPDTITLVLTNTTYRHALDEICRLANLSWRLTPPVLVARPEYFLESKEIESIEQGGPGYPPQGVGSPDP